MGREKWEEEESLAWEWNAGKFLAEKKKMLKIGFSFWFQSEVDRR